MVEALDSIPRYAEFFCGGGMVRAALRDRFTCVLANDIDPMKCRVYAQNFGASNLIQDDIARLDHSFLRQHIDLYWASSPCQDFSLAGKGMGISGHRGGVFEFWMNKVRQAVERGFPPRLIAFENVTGLMSRGSGRDFIYVLRSIASAGYLVGALEIDARRFVAQSRPRLFVIAARSDIRLSNDLTDTKPIGVFHTPRLARFVARAPTDIRDRWVWWKHTAPTTTVPSLATLIDTTPDTPWFSKSETDTLIARMSSPSLARLDAARRTGKLEACTVYKRGRPDENGNVRQRAELRWDGLAGCLRTPGGGSSRQTLMLVKGNELRARLFSTREIARLMGLPDTYIMPSRYNEAYKVAGDGVVVPVVRYLDKMLFQPLLTVARAEVAA